MNSSPEILVVEDDRTVRTVVGDYLSTQGFSVTLVDNGADVLRQFAEHRPDLVVLDRMLPGLSGDEVCRRLREISDVPIIMLTALDAVPDRIAGLESGADDYLAKPFALKELRLRIDGLLRRARQAGSSPLEFSLGPFRVDPAKRRVWRDGAEISLTTREYELFLFFLRNPGRTVTREEILQEVWEWHFGDASNVTVHIRRLREKVEADPRYPAHLVTVWGSGYRFDIRGERE
ncbi:MULTISPECIES: response regulator transcription factor [Arthrobacter]|uniref:Response regulator transcription factor n=2 Tax=Arthrobacter TaxID=1663 RepID=A0ABU9KLY3_9MICC|nr:response regulator transcription factor [Arthrobacter sp. YJM1]MDP5228210.1 response regulator transcription factor [Arthrobacter sp. YJM1]